MTTVTKWSKGLDEVKNFVVKIEIPDSYGTGFLITRRKRQEIVQVGIATAYHVIAHAERWLEPIRLIHYISNKEVVILPNQRQISVNQNRDLALLCISENILPFAKDIPAINKEPTIIPSGTHVGWCGFPNIVRNRLCFFAGHISANYDEAGDYLVDGVAIHGVSGGPAFYMDNEKAVILGLVTNYFPNVATGQVLPGISLIRSVKHYIDYFESQKVKIVKQKAT